MKRYTIGLTILLALMNTGCEDKKDDEFSLNGTWLSIFGKMDGSNEPVVFFDTDNKIFTAAYVNGSNTANGCYCYHTFTYDYNSGNKYSTSGGGELIVEEMDSGNIKVRFGYLWDSKEFEYSKESNNIESDKFNKCSSDCR